MSRRRVERKITGCLVGVGFNFSQSASGALGICHVDAEEGQVSKAAPRSYDWEGLAWVNRVVWGLRHEGAGAMLVDRPAD